MNSNGYITAPISLKDDVYTVLGISPSGAYYDLAEACTSDAINKWSRHKPLDIDQIEPLDYSNPTHLALIDKIRYGLSFTKESYYNMFQNATWVYTKPSTVYRLTDFEEYDHKAVPPLIIKFPDEIKSNGIYQVRTEMDQTKRNYTFDVTFGPQSAAQASTSVTLQEVLYDDGLVDEMDYYFTIAMRWKTSEESDYSYCMATSTKTMSELMDSAGGQLQGTGITVYMQETPFCELPADTEIDIAAMLQPTLYNVTDTSLSNTKNCVPLESSDGYSYKTYKLVKTSWYYGLNASMVATVTEEASQASRTYTIETMDITFWWDDDAIKTSVFCRPSAIIAGSMAGTTASPLGDTFLGPSVNTQKSITTQQFESAEDGKVTISYVSSELDTDIFTIDMPEEGSGITENGTFQINANVYHTTLDDDGWTSSYIERKQFPGLYKVTWSGTPGNITTTS